MVERNFGFDMTKCEICGKDGVVLLRAKHRELGIIKMCSECVESEWHDLLPSGCGCCGGGEHNWIEKQGLTSQSKEVML